MKERQGIYDSETKIYSNQLITVGDLEKFKRELVQELTHILKEGGGRPLKKWLKSSEVRKLLNISPGKLQTLRVNGTLAYTRIGGVIYYEQEDINKMFDKHKVKIR